MAAVRRLGLVVVCAVTIVGFAGLAHADEIWVAPTAQQDLGGMGIASNAIWPASPFGAVRLALSIPDNLSALLSAKMVLIPHSSASGPSTLHIIVCSSENGDAASA